MADIGRMLAGFVQGSTGYAVDRIKAREDEERELRKARLLEELRKDTAKELAIFEENLPSAKLRREKEMQDMEFAREDQSMDREGFELDKGYKALDYQYKASDEKREQEKHGMSLALDSERIKSERVSRARSLSGGAGASSKGTKGNQILFAEYDRTIKELRDSGANASVVANFQTMWNEGVNMKGWSPSQQRVFLQRMRESFTSGFTDKKGNQHKPLLQTYGSNTDPILEAKVKGG